MFPPSGFPDQGIPEQRVQRGPWKFSPQGPDILSLSFFALESSNSTKYYCFLQETWVLSLGWDNPLEEEMETHSSILTWEIPWTEEPGALQSIGHKE